MNLHFLRWSRYRADVFIWILTIWCTLGMQAVFLYVTYSVSGGNFFGYMGHEVIGFFGVALVASGIAQSVVVGVIITLSKAVWRGNLDHWLLQPPPFLLRIVTEELGIVWYWPHIVVGSGIIVWMFPASLWLLAFAAAFAASTIEMGIVLLLCLPAIRWGRWDPYEGLWEYFENARSIPIGRSGSIMLWLASFGVLQYSLALEVITGRLSILLLLLISACVWALALLLLKILIRSYGSASS
ncbi:MAG: ABC-2 family transporter protein [Candidatus Peribacteraceae bacterium]|nr:ABC-2 family transporter protein [Candidatus Peribacteraceae bacterium]MDD5739915.1 ABC-2 family transporter protein [Candidatus Peribacteraceae bacterium]